MSGTDTARPEPVPTPVPGAAGRTGLVRRALDLLAAETTEMAPSTLDVPLSYYRDPGVLAQERAVVARTPLALLPSNRIAAPHDFAVREVLGSSVLVTRGRDGTAHSFLNYCRHRGAEVASGCGSARRLVCPYHAWTYTSEGRLVGLPGADGFDDVDRSTRGLVALPTEERHGFVWVVLTAGAPIDVADHLGPMDEELASWGFGGYEFLTERRFDAAVNWKAALEAFAESYHFPYVHGQSLIGMNTIPNTATFDRFGPHHRLGFPNPWIADAPADLREHPTPLDYVVLIYWLFPNLVVAVSPVGVELIDILPGEDPGSCTVTHGWMAATPPPDQATRAGYEQLFELVHDAVRTEDFAMLPTCGNGIRHGQHESMVIGRNEIGVQHLVRTFAAALGLELDLGPGL